MQAPVVHILGLTTIRRERLLPVSGRVVARLDQKVSPVDVVAEANYGQKHAMIDVARTLGITVDKAQKIIQCKVGDQLANGQVVAQHTGLVPRTVRAPSDGRVVLVGDGRILLQVGESGYELRAGMPGMVTRVIPDRGVEITAHGALVQGVWGNDCVDMGLMLPICSAADDVLTADKLDVSLRGSILLGAICEDPRVLQTAAELPVRGLILGSMAPGLIPIAQQMRYPILVLDGFGRRPMNSAAFKLLYTSGKREVSLNTETFDRHTGVRPEAIIPLSVNQEPAPPRELEVFAPGQTVCIQRNPYIGKTGILVSLTNGPVVFPSGLRAPGGEVRLENSEQVLIPLANLEVIG